MILQIIIIVLLIALSAFFSASETALTGVNRIRLKHKAENPNGGKVSVSARKALKLLEKYEKSLTTLLIGNNVVNLAASSIATVFTISVLPSEMDGYGALVSTGIITLAVITFGEILPKTLAREHAEGFLLASAGFLRMLGIILTPVSALFLLIQQGTSRLFRKKEKEVSVTEAELMKIIDEIEDEGVLEEQESHLVRNALEFDETTVGEVLTPRVRMVGVAVNDSVEKVRDIFLSEGYSRLPVYDKSPDKIVGILNNKDFTRSLLNPDNPDFSVKSIMQEAEYIPALMKLSEALKIMQREKAHLAVVVDQYGGTEGIVTLEDILEELVGEIWDEGDEITAPVRFLNERVFEVVGSLHNNDFNRFFEKKAMDYRIDSEANTVGGWVFELFGRIPAAGENVKSGDFKITVLNMAGKRIERLRFEILKDLD